MSPTVKERPAKGTRRPTTPKTASRSPADPTTTYARDVVAGRIVAGKFIRQASERHLRDLLEGPKRGLVWRPDLADKVYTLFGLLKHWKGRWAGQPFTLEPWEMFALGLLWGWRRADGTRRFRRLHLEVARKNGKSTLAAGISLATLILDREGGAEVYTCATKKDQARITFSDAAKFVNACPSLKRLVRVNKSNLSVETTGSKLEPLAADSNKLDGLNLHCGVCDELHAWKQRMLWDVLDTATGARSQPLLVVTTTAGHDRHSIWWELREEAIKVLDGTFANDQILALIWTLDDNDDWTDERCWPKANPNLGVSLRLEELREKCEEAKATPGKQNSFRRLRLNQPTEQAARWLDLARWDSCCEPVTEEQLRGRDCYIGLDLAQTIDLAAEVLLFPPNSDDRKWRFLGRFWVPGDRVGDRVRKDRVPYDSWARAGFIRLTDGNAIDYATIEAQVLADAQKFIVKELAFDRMFALPIIQRLQAEGVSCVAFGQGFISMAAPVKEFERMLIAKDIATPAVDPASGWDRPQDPCWRWQAGNVSVREDPAGNRKPDKGASSEKIDGVVALLMALGRAIAEPVQSEPTFYMGEDNEEDTQAHR